MTSRAYAFMAAIVMLLFSGLLYQTQAGNTEQLERATAHVAEVPHVIGDWQANDETSDARAFEQAGAKSYWTRRYVHQKTKDSVLVILMCGRAGKMAVHTPEVCYGGAGYEVLESATSCSINGGQFWTAKFAKKGSQLRLYWAWNGRGAWEAAASPRWQYFGAPFLYKLYVSREISGPTSIAADADPAAQFLREFDHSTRLLLDDGMRSR